jgi:hypothetical protein
MKILLDESVPQKLRLRIDTQHEVFITSDQEMYYQQNLAARRIAILVLGTNNRAAIQLRIPEINAAIDQLSGQDYRFLDLEE